MLVLDAQLLQRDDVWRKALLITLPVHQVAAVMATFDRVRPEFQDVPEDVRQAVTKDDLERLRATNLTLSNEPRFELPKVEGDIIQ